MLHEMGVETGVSLEGVLGRHGRRNRSSAALGSHVLTAGPVVWNSPQLPRCARRSGRAARERAPTEALITASARPTHPRSSSPAAPTSSCADEECPDRRPCFATREWSATAPVAGRRAGESVDDLVALTVADGLEGSSACRHSRLGGGDADPERWGVRPGGGGDDRSCASTTRETDRVIDMPAAEWASATAERSSATTTATVACRSRPPSPDRPSRARWTRRARPHAGVPVGGTPAGGRPRGGP